MSETDNNMPGKWNIAAALATWLVPGLGHFLLGQRKRGVILFVAITLMWLGGLLLGGISVVDRNYHPVWFLGQMFVSPSVVVNYYHNRLNLAGEDSPAPKKNMSDPKPAYVPSFGELHEQGTLFTGLAGILNVLVILDVIYRDPKSAKYEVCENAQASEGM